jgi:hypothetical protein
VLSSGVVDDLITKDGGLFDVLVVVASEDYALAASRGVAKHDPYGIADASGANSKGRLVETRRDLSA